MLAPDALIMDIVAQEIATQRSSKQFLFDGIPRSMVQALSFDEHVPSVSHLVQYE
ncbi:MAG: nucleoside monophosphate kinase [Bacteroidota bacterium]